MLDRLTGMQVFTRVVGLGSLSAAARALGMSQTMATKHLGALEDRLGVKLLHRSTRRMTLTEAGRKYLDAAERILTDIEDVEAEAAAEHVEVRGTLRLNVPVSFGIREIGPLIPEFSAAHPSLSLEVAFNDRHVDLIEEGWDMVVRIGRLEPSSLVARRMAPCRTALCASPAYLAARGTPRTLADLQAHNALGYTLSRSLGEDRWAFGKDGSTVVQISGNLKANSGEGLLAAAIAGQGLLYVPTFIVWREILAGRLVRLTLDQPAVELGGVYACYPSTRRPPAKVRTFIDFLVGKFGPEPHWDTALDGHAAQSVKPSTRT